MAQGIDVIHPTDDRTVAVLPYLTDLWIGGIRRGPIHRVCGIIHELPQHVMATTHMQNIERGSFHGLEHAHIVGPPELLIFRVGQPIVCGPAGRGIE